MMLDTEYQSMAANAICHAATMAGNVVQEVAWGYGRPCVVFKPRLFVDGNKWCAWFGQNVQDGVAGFGDSPSEAMYAFDHAWTEKLPVKS